MPAEPGPGRRCGVLGSPISHSLSPVLHQAAYGELGLDWTYTAHSVGEEQLAAFMAAMGGEWRGLSLTMPLKRVVIGLLDRVEDRGRLLGSINTVVVEESGGRAGHNTDVDGLVRAMRAAGVRRLGAVMVVGAGSTAASALAAAAELGASRVTVAARRPARAQQLVALGPALGLAVDVVPLDEVGVPGPVAGGQVSGGRVSGGPVDAVISTIPADGQAGVADRLAGLAHLVFDVCYHPRHTPLLLAAGRAGVTAIPGFELLLHQAARQVELMTGVRPAPTAAMRAAGLAALDARHP